MVVMVISWCGGYGELWWVIRRLHVVPAKSQGHQGEERIQKRRLRTTRAAETVVGPGSDWIRHTCCSTCLSVYGNPGDPSDVSAAGATGRKTQPVSLATIEHPECTILFLSVHQFET